MHACDVHTGSQVYARIEPLLLLLTEQAWQCCSSQSLALLVSIDLSERSIFGPVPVRALRIWLTPPFPREKKHYYLRCFRINRYCGMLLGTDLMVP